MTFRFLFLFLVFGLSAQASNAFCPVAEEPSITINFTETPLRYDYQPNIGELQSYNRQHMGIYLGLTLSNTPANYNFDVQPYFEHGNQKCLSYNKIDVNIQLHQEIMIPQEVKENRCMSESVMEHEMKHVETNRQVIENYIPVFEKAVRQATLERRLPKSFGPLEPSEVAPLMTRLKAEMDRVVQAEFNKMQQAIRAAQAQVDTPEEYKRVKDQCLRDQRTVVGKFKKHWRLEAEAECEAMRDDDAKEACKDRVADRF